METKGSVRLGRMFCPANDRNVPILFRRGRAQIDPAVWAGPEEPVSCLDYGFRCTGWLCPHFAVPELPGPTLLEQAVKTERGRGGRGGAERRRVLERALQENRLRADRALDDGGGPSSTRRERLDGPAGSLDRRSGPSGAGSGEGFLSPA